MRYTRLFLLPLLMLASLAKSSAVSADEIRIGVIDSVRVITESDAGKNYARQSEARFKKRVQDIKALESEIVQMEDKQKKDGSTLGKEHSEILRIQLQRKYEDHQIKNRQLIQDKEEADTAERDRLRPKLQKAIDEVTTELNLDMLFDRQVLIFVNPKIDVTRKVLDRLNKMK